MTLRLACWDSSCTAQSKVVVRDGSKHEQIDTLTDNKRRSEIESEVVDKKPNKSSNWKVKRKHQDVEIADYTCKRININRGFSVSQVFWQSRKMSRHCVFHTIDSDSDSCFFACFSRSAWSGCAFFCD